MARSNMKMTGRTARIAFSSKSVHDAAVLKTKGISPAQKSRSKATFDALIRAGLEIIEEKEFNSTTIGDVAALAGASVGAFYERFESKEVFFAALQEILATEIELAVRRRVADPSFADYDATTAISVIVTIWLAGIRKHRGLVRASLRHLPERAEAWFPLARLGKTMTEIYVDVLYTRLKGRPREVLSENVKIAIQFVHGLVVNMILNEPGPLRLDDEKLGRSICRAISLLVEIDGVRGEFYNEKG